MKQLEPKKKKKTVIIAAKIVTKKKEPRKNLFQLLGSILLELIAVIKPIIQIDLGKTLVR